MKAYIIKQFDYNQWANRQVCAHLRELGPDVYRKEIVSVFPTIYAVMTHVHVIDCNWLTFFESGGVAEMTPDYIEELKARTDRLVSETDGLSIEELDRLMTDNVAKLRSFVERHDDLGTTYPSGAFRATCADYLLHLIHHGTYHRGNVAAMLRQLGHRGTPTDFGYYLYATGL